MEMVNIEKTLHENSKDATKQLSNIREYFSEKTVFVTGATGFLGIILVEKLLRACTDLRKIYILIRPKKDKSCEKRFEEYFDNVIFEPLKRKYPKALEKVFMVSGDCSLPDLGLSEDDQQVLISEVNCLFHLAATVRFDEKIWKAAIINVKGTRDILTLARKIKNLSSFVYVSTAFSFCPRKEIEEKVYKPKVTEEQLMTLFDTFTEDELEELTPFLLGKWPNTYVLTKSVAEAVLQKEGVGLPVAIVRPSIVIATSKEPVSGWIDNFYGATGMFVGAALGLIRTMHCELDNLAEMVPADYVVNCIIASAWDTANIKGSQLNSELTQSAEDQGRTDISVYNYVSSPQRPITWRECMDKGNRHTGLIASPLQVWHFIFLPHSNKLVYLFLHYMLHMLPAYIVDFLAFCIGKKPQLVKGYRKIEKFLNVIAYFATRQWSFRNNNTQKLWEKLNHADKKMFEFNMSSLDWDLYFYTFSRGARVYLVKDPMTTIPSGQVKRFRLKLAHYALVGVILLGVAKVLTMCLNSMFSLF